MATPKKKEHRLTDASYWIDGPLDKAIAYLESERTRLTSEGFTDLRLDVGISEGYYGDSPSAEVVFYGYRMETMEEAILRESMVKYREKQIEERQRLQYEELKKKFGET